MLRGGCCLLGFPGMAESQRPVDRQEGSGTDGSLVSSGAQCLRTADCREEREGSRSDVQNHPEGGEGVGDVRACMRACGRGRRWVSFHSCPRVLEFVISDM